jgi:hypothetical protein
VLFTKGYPIGVYFQCMIVRQACIPIQFFLRMILYSVLDIPIFSLLFEYRRRYRKARLVDRHVYAYAHTENTSWYHITSHHSATCMHASQPPAITAMCDDVARTAFGKLSSAHTVRARNLPCVICGWGTGSRYVHAHVCYHMLAFRREPSRHISD